MRLVWTARAALGVLMAISGLAGCDDVQPKSQPPAEKHEATQTAFSHRTSGDLSGYYTPVGVIAVDGYRVKALFLGQDADFAAWEAGSKSGEFAPVMLEFEKDGAAPIRVLPATYAVSDGQVRFEGRDARLGQVAFTGTLDEGALATARRNLGDEAPVLTGTLRAGGTAFGNQKFRWYGGD